MFATRILLATAILWLSSCSLIPSAALPDPPKAIVGGTLIDGTGRPPIADALVLVESGKIVIASSSNGLKIPGNAVETNAKGLYITPSQPGARLEYGAPADLFLLSGNPLDNPLILGSPMRVMKTGEWLDANKK